MLRERDWESDMFKNKVTQEQFEILLNRVRHIEEWRRNLLNDYDTMSRGDFYSYTEKADDHNTLLADAIGMEFKTEAATPSKTEEEAENDISSILGNIHEHPELLNKGE